MTHSENEMDCSTVQQVSDEDWLASHRALIDMGAIPENELGYLYDPDRDPETVAVEELTVEHDPAEPNR